VNFNQSGSEVFPDLEPMDLKLIKEIGIGNWELGKEMIRYQEHKMDRIRNYT